MTDGIGGHLQDRIAELERALAGAAHADSALEPLLLPRYWDPRNEIFELAEVFRGNVVDIGTRHVILEISGPEAKIEAILQLLKPYGIKEVARSGRIAMLRGIKEA